MKVILFLLQKSIILLILSLDIQGQAPNSPKSVDPADNLIQEMRKNMARDRKMLEQYFNSSFLDRVDNFFKDSQLHLDQDPDYQKMLSDFESSFQGMGSGIKSEWRETKQGKVFVIHAALEENGKFDLKVKDNKITVSGQLKRRIGAYGNRTMTFKKEFTVPQDVDVNKVEIKAGKSKGTKKKDDEILLVFPWLKDKGPMTRPVRKGMGDKTI